MDSATALPTVLRLLAQSLAKANQGESGQGESGQGEDAPVTKAIEPETVEHLRDLIANPRKVGEGLGQARVPSLEIATKAQQDAASQGFWGDIVKCPDGGWKVTAHWQ